MDVLKRIIHTNTVSLSTGLSGDIKSTFVQLFEESYFFSPMAGLDQRAYEKWSEEDLVNRHEYILESEYQENKAEEEKRNMPCVLLTFMIDKKSGVHIYVFI